MSSSEQVGAPSALAEADMALVRSKRAQDAVQQQSTEAEQREAEAARRAAGIDIKAFLTMPVVEEEYQAAVAHAQQQSV